MGIDLPKTYFGAWTEDNIFSDLKVFVKENNISFGAWYCTDDFSIEDAELEINVEKGDWLVYICEKDSSGVDHSYWKKSEGLAVFNANSSFNFPSPGEYTKVTIDNAGNIVNADNLNEEDIAPQVEALLKNFLDKSLSDKIFISLKSIFAQQSDNPIQISFDDETQTLELYLKIDDETIKVEDGRLIGTGSGEGGGGSSGDKCCANHTHTVDDIEGLTEFLDSYIQEIRIVEAISNNLPSLVDGKTIVVNNKGQLEAIAMAVPKHTHSKRDITDLNLDIIDTYATDQNIKEGKNSKIDFTGYTDLNKLNIGHSIQAVNAGLLEVDQIAKEALDKAGTGGVTVEKPATLDLIDFKTSGNNKVLVNRNIGKEELCYRNICFESLDPLFLDYSTLKIFIDEKVAASVKFEEYKKYTVKYTDESFSGFLEVVPIGDIYYNYPVGRNKYFGYKLSIKFDNTQNIIKNTLSEGTHSVVITQIRGPESYKKVFSDFLMYQSNGKLVSITPKVEVPPAGYTSGIPFSTNSVTLEIKVEYNEKETYTLKNTIEYEDPFTHKIKSLGYRSTSENIPIPKEIPTGSYGLDVLYNYKDGTVFKQTLNFNIYRNSSYIEENRLRIITNESQVLSFEKYIPSTPLNKINSSLAEAQIQDNKMVYAKENYSNIKGPDYSSFPGRQQLCLSIPLNNKKLYNFVLPLKFNQEMTFTNYGLFEKVSIRAIFANKNLLTKGQIIDCNQYWNGRISYSKEQNTFYHGLDLNRSNKDMRVITLGGTSVEEDYLILVIEMFTDDKNVSLDIDFLLRKFKEINNV